MTKAQSTIDAYLKRGHQLWLRAAKSYVLSLNEITSTMFIDWLERLLPGLKPTSRRQYIAASKQLLLTLDGNIEFSALLLDEFNRAVQRLQEMQSADYSLNKHIAKPWQGKTSNQKSKHLKISDLSKIVKQSTDMRGKWIRPALLWITANMIVGLRPSEWRYAHLNIIAEKIIFTVRNAKNTNGRANGEYRNLDLTHLHPDELKLVKTQINAIKPHTKDDASWNQYYQGVRKAIYRITRAALPNKRRYPTLYTSRHQFAANAKSAGMNKVEIAALMGHAIDETAGMHYGKSKHGRGVCLVKANAEEMATVRIKCTGITNVKKSNKGV